MSFRHERKNTFRSIVMLNRADPAWFSLFGKDEVASEKFMSLERGSNILRLQYLNIFAGITSTPVAFWNLVSK